MTFDKDRKHNAQRLPSVKKAVNGQWSMVNGQKGFGLVEVIVSLSILTLVMLGLQFLARMAFYSWENAQNKTIAYNIIQDTIECFSHLRNTNVLDIDTANWDSFIVDGQYTGDYIGGGGNDCPLNGPDNFSRDITIQSLPSKVAFGTLDGLKKKITVKISWIERLRPVELMSSTYLTDWRGNF